MICITIFTFQHEMQLLRLENERLQACNGNYVQPTSVSAHKLSLDLPSISPFAISSELELDASPNSLKSFDTGVSGLGKTTNCSKMIESHCFLASLKLTIFSLDETFRYF